MTLRRFLHHAWRSGVLGLLLVLGSAAPPAARAADGFQPLFDGQTLAGWDGNPKFWRVEDGCITGETTPENPTKGNTFLVWRNGEVDDFELTLEYRIVSPKGNSGIQYRSFEDPEKWGQWVIGGYQADCDADNNYSGILYGEKYRGILCQRGQKVTIESAGPGKAKVNVVEKFADGKELGQFIHKGEQWNSYRIVARGFHFTHEINGKLTADATDDDTQVRRRGGLLALQLHAGPPMKVQFRNILLKRLPLANVKKVVLIAGKPSHGYAGHQHNAGCLLLARLLNENVRDIYATVYRSGWPKDPTALDNADAIVIFSDGGKGHPLLPHLEELAPLMKKGVGLGCIHYAVEVPKDQGGAQLLDWIGGYFEQFWSVNPHWRAEFTSLPDHPVARGVKPFAIDDEWYYHMRFREGMQGVTPILTAIPPDKTRERPDGPHSNNPTVRAGKGQPEHVGWVYQRPGGGRGFGFTGGHWHWNWGNDGFRTTVLNAIVWTAGLDVPPGGVPSKTPTLEELEANQDYPKPKKFDTERVKKMLEEWQTPAAK